MSYVDKTYIITVSIKERKVIILSEKKFNMDTFVNSVSVKDVGFCYKGSQKRIFTKANMEVPSGQFCCLLGQSGCGKSTLLRLIAGLEKPTNGEIFFDGVPHRGPGLEKGVVFQDYGLYPWMSTGKNIELAIEQRYPKMSKQEKEEKAKTWIEKVGLKPEVYSMLPKELSGGMRQRCAIARAFAIDSPILLMDEPFGALDAVTRSNLQDMLLELWREANPKKTVFFVTHDVDESLLLAERIFVIGQGSNDIVFGVEVSDEQRLVRGKEDNHETIELRNELIYQINEDVQAMAEQN